MNNRLVVLANSLEPEGKSSLFITLPGSLVAFLTFPTHLNKPLYLLQLHPVELFLETSLSGKLAPISNFLLGEVDHDAGEYGAEQFFKSRSHLGGGNRPRN